MKTKHMLSQAAIYAILLMGSIICLLPIYWMFRTALIDMGQIFQKPPQFIPADLQWSNFATALGNYPFGTYFLNSVLVTGLSVLACC